MRLARFQKDNECYLGMLDQTGARLREIVAPRGGSDPMIAIIHAILNREELSLGDQDFAITQVRFLPPIAQPSKNVLCVGKNYAAHVAEIARSDFDTLKQAAVDAVPNAPIIFSKAACTMSGARDDIKPPWSLTDKVDYEGELGVVIGRGGRAIARADAYEHVWGYTIINDVTARDLQAKHKQWLLGKSIDTFCPVGPWIVSADEVDPANLDLKSWVNGELRQSANTRELIFDIPTIIETISASMSLNTGDIIATGTPAGVGIGFDPPKFLHPGDQVRIAISGLGEIENTVV